MPSNYRPEKNDGDGKQTTNWKPVRYVLRVPLPFDNLVIQATCEGAELFAPLAVLETEQTTKVYTGKLDGQRHKGGVTFDVISN